ncbi:hypothetical protein RM780_00190 [Streptomyces sp. DSM 44917]|uniref:Uncharacterized protein n=1 Tax=Streptomyces boetiae TaxID=3075541 RepID=A0ABU2L1I2_9ACTN|nr:hypothetical protein [Streptomyces sp. DSM 44917]MDT0305385.1 hypothetical protein [Streptomyces sp. DSM 44917]
MPVLVDPRTVRCGDTILVGGPALTVENMTLLGLGARRLEFGGGETFTMRPATALWASRKVDPRRGRGKSG